MPAICLWTPAPLGSRRGNRITSNRWARLLRACGFEVTHTHAAPRGSGGILLALHAVAARPVLLAWRGGPRVAVVTGTDLNGDQVELAMDTLAQVDAIITLQSLDRLRLPASLQAKTRVILPSVELPPGLAWRPPARPVAIAVGHLREVKQPLTLPQALLHKPDWEGLHIGGEIEPGWPRQLEGWPRFRWLGEKTRPATLKRLAGGSCFVLSSRSEGCSNALCEALALGMPVLVSDIAGNRGLLGEDFPGYFPVGDASALASLLCAEKLVSIQEFVRPWSEKLKPSHEQDALCSLLAELSGPSYSRRG